MVFNFYYFYTVMYCSTLYFYKIKHNKAKKNSIYLYSYISKHMCTQHLLPYVILINYILQEQYSEAFLILDKFYLCSTYVSAQHTFLTECNTTLKLFFIKTKFLGML